MKNALEGTATLYFATLKQSIRSIWPWILAIVLLSASSYAAYGRVFPNLEDQQNLNAAVQSNPAFNLIFGKAGNLLSAEGFTAWRSVVLGGFLSAMMSILLVAKHTRAKEDSGEEELIASSVVGRYSLTTVALGVAFTACLIAAVFSSLPLVGLGADPSFAMAFGLTVAAVGAFFASISALMAQIVSHSRTVVSASVTVLGVSYLLRGIADTVDEASWMANFSPLGWAQKTNLATDINYAPVAFLVVTTVAVAAFAYIFKSQRDFGQGIIADKPGSDRARKFSSIYGLAFRLQKTSVISWSFAFVFLGGAFGYLLDSVGSAFSSNEGLANFVGASEGAAGSNFVFEFASTLLTIIGIIAAVYGTQLILRLYSEEMSHRSEPLLAGSVTRSKHFVSHAQFAVFGSISAMLLTGITLITVVTINDVSLTIRDVFEQTLLTTPAVLVHVGLALAVVGFAPKFRWLAWLGIAISFGLTLLGPILNLSDTLLAISPFWHISSAISDDISLTSTFVMSGISIALITIGLLGYRLRDIARV